MKKKIFEIDVARGDWFEDISRNGRWNNNGIPLDTFLAEDGKTITIRHIAQQWDNHIIVFYDNIIEKEPLEL